MGSLIVFRILQGVFCGIIQPVTITIIYQMLPVERVPFALGFMVRLFRLRPCVSSYY